MQAMSFRRVIGSAGIALLLVAGLVYWHVRDADDAVGTRELAEAGPNSGADPGVSGTWPGLAGLEIGMRRPRPPATATVEPPGDSPVLPLIDQIARFETLPAEQQPAAARAIAQAWEECWNHVPIEFEELNRRVERSVESRQRFLAELLAQLPESEETREIIDRYAAIDPKTMRDESRREFLARQVLCAGTEDVQAQARFRAETDWWRRAARLGDRAARFRFLDEAFGNGVYAGRARQIAADKQLILEILAERLAWRDLVVLDSIARMVAEGWFAEPDPQLAHAWRRAAQRALDAPDLAGWTLALDTAEVHAQLSHVLEFNSRRSREALSPEQRAEAERLAKIILRQGGGR